MNEHKHIWGLDDERQKAICKVCDNASKEEYWKCITNVTDGISKENES